MKVKLIIVNSRQFGDHIDTYYYCKDLSAKYSIVYICWDHGLPKINTKDVNVEYVDRSGGLIRIARFVKRILNFTISTDTIIFINYFKLIPTLIRILRPIKAKL